MRRAGQARRCIRGAGPAPSLTVYFAAHYLAPVPLDLCLIFQDDFPLHFQGMTQAVVVSDDLDHTAASLGLRDPTVCHHPCHPGIFGKNYVWRNEWMDEEINDSPRPHEKWGQTEREPTGPDSQPRDLFLLPMWAPGGSRA